MIFLFDRGPARPYCGSTMKNPVDKKRDLETTALLWLVVASKCDANLVGSRELALGLASLAMESADAVTIDAECHEIV